MKTNILIVIMSCYKNNHLWNKLKHLDNRSVIFYGNNNQKEEYILNDRILSLKCKDTYDYLPIKVLLMIKAISNLENFKDITHILKIDDHDTKFNKNTIDSLSKIISFETVNYGGQLVHRENINSLIHIPHGGNRN